MADPMTAPPGGDQDKAPLLRTVISVELSITAVIIALRLYTRLKLVRNGGWDDWIMLATFVLAFVGSSLHFVGMEYGIGRHVYYLSHASTVKALEIDWVSQSFVIAAQTIGKISVSFLILRLSITKWHIWFLQTINVTLIIINIPLITLTYTQCKPTALLWNPTLKGSCWDPRYQGTLSLFQGSYGAVTDLVYALFPILLIWNLQMPSRRKAMLASIMCLGVFSAIAAAFKTFYLQQLRSRSDFTYDGTLLMIWGTTEMYVIIIAGSLPTLRPLVQQSIAKSKSLINNQKGYQSYPHDHNLAHPLQNLNRVYDTTGNLKSPKVHHRDVDVSSDQSILQSRITKTTDVRISYDEDGIQRRVPEWEQHHMSSESINAVENV